MVPCPFSRAAVPNACAAAGPAVPANADSRVACRPPIGSRAILLADIDEHIDNAPAPGPELRHKAASAAQELIAVTSGPENSSSVILSISRAPGEYLPYFALNAVFQVSEGHLQPGIVLVGDAFSTSCPAAGTGTTKVFTDVERLCNVYIPRLRLSEGVSRTIRARLVARATPRALAAKQAAHS
jgi:2-polyprenyl-6-methoxyphenol hydroxylase-like FAD-dependent oxidoreductase